MKRLLAFGLLATLALAVSAIVKAEAGGYPERVGEIYGRFGAMVMMPSEAIVRVYAREWTERGDAIFFEAINADGGRAIPEHGQDHRLVEERPSGLRSRPASK